MGANRMMRDVERCGLPVRHADADMGTGYPLGEELARGDSPRLLTLSLPIGRYGGRDGLLAAQPVVVAQGLVMSCTTHPSEATGTIHHDRTGESHLERHRAYTKWVKRLGGM